MTSYLLYVATAMRNFLYLSIEGDKRYVPIWKYYPQLKLKQSQYHFKRINGAFFGHFFYFLDKSLENKRVLDQTWEMVDKCGCMFLQFPTSTYLTVGCFDDQPFMLPIYPSEKIVLMELA